MNKVTVLVIVGVLGKLLTAGLNAYARNLAAGTLLVVVPAVADTVLLGKIDALSKGIVTVVSPLIIIITVLAGGVAGNAVLTGSAAENVIVYVLVLLVAIAILHRQHLDAAHVVGIDLIVPDCAAVLRDVGDRRDSLSTATAADVALIGIVTLYVDPGALIRVYVGREHLIADAAATSGETR